MFVCLKVAGKSFRSICKHRECASVVCFPAEACHENKRHVLGQFYDEVCRKEWSLRAERGMIEMFTCL